MTRVALRGLAGRKLRTILTSLAIVLGVAMVSGTFVLTDTIGKAFDQIFTSSYDETDAIVSGRKQLEWSQSGNATVPASLLEEIRALPEVEAAAGTMMNVATGTDEARLIGSDGEPIVGSGPTFGFGLDPEAQLFNPMELVDGRWATGPEEVVIDAGVAGRADFGIGDRIEIAANGPRRPYEIVGVARFGEVDSIGDATIAVFDLETAQGLYGKDGRFDAIGVAARDGVSQEELVRRIEPLLPATAQAVTGTAQAQADSDSIGEFVSFIRYALLAFGGIALFVGAFVIFNTISITVAQRTRELATLRTLGASRRQVLRSVVVEALAIGALASVLGIALGVGLAKGLNALFVAIGLDLPTASTVFAARTPLVAFLLGTGITVLAGLFPAIRATRVPPISAVREGALVAGPPRRRTAVAGGVVLALGVVALVYALNVADGVAPVILGLIVGALASLLGVAMLASRLVRPIAALVGLPAARIGGVAGRLARDNSIRNPGRTAATAAALMIGLALVTTVAVLGNGLRSSDREAIESQLGADYVLQSENGWSPLPLAAGQAVAAAPGVVRASSARYDRARIGDGEIDVSGIDPATISGLYRFEWSEGSDATLATLGRDGAVVREQVADDHELAVGSSFRLTTPAGEDVRLVVRGIYDPPRFDPLLGHVLLSSEGFAAAFPRPRDAYTFADVEDDAAGLRAALAAFPDAELRSSAEFVEARSSDLSSVLNLFYVLLALSVIVSLFGMVNTLVLSVFERTRELGMLRAIGMTRRQARRMVRHESVITALIGAALGLPLGLAFAALVTQAVSEYGIGYSLPAGTLAIFAVVAVVAGILAAVLPARRAARLNVLAALQYE